MAQSVAGPLSCAWTVNQSRFLRIERATRQPRPWGRWLDGRFSKGFLINVESPARSVCLWAWSLEVGRIAMGGKQSFKQEYSAPPNGLTPQDCEADGFEFYDEHVA